MQRSGANDVRVELDNATDFIITGYESSIFALARRAGWIVGIIAFVLGRFLFAAILFFCLALIKFLANYVSNRMFIIQRSHGRFVHTRFNYEILKRFRSEGEKCAIRLDPSEIIVEGDLPTIGVISAKPTNEWMPTNLRGSAQDVWLKLAAARKLVFDRRVRLATDEQRDRFWQWVSDMRSSASASQ